MKLAILTLLAAGAMAPLAHAETDAALGGAFDGPFVSAQFGAQRASAVEANVQTTVQPGLSFNQPDALGEGGVFQIHGGYGRDIGRVFNLTVAGFAEFGGAGLAPTRATFFGDAVEQDITNRIGVYVAPGVYLDLRTVVFAKIGVAQAEHRYSRALPGVALSPRISGQMLGVGVKRMLDDHIFWSADYTRVDYGRTQIGAGVALNGHTVDIQSRAITEEVSVGFGYQF